MSRIHAIARLLLRPGPLLIGLILVELLLLFRGGNPLAVREAIAGAEADGKVPWELDVRAGISLAAAVNLVIAIGLWFTRKWWLPTRADSDQPAANPSPTGHGFSMTGRRLFWAGLAVAMLLGTGLRWNLAGRSLWWDELWNLRENSHGKMVSSSKTESGTKFRTNGWDRAFWYYQKPTHHGPMAVAVKASLTTWRNLSDAEDGDFSNRAIRAPALIASALSILGIALLLRKWGHPYPGLLAALILAIHPWAIRYGIDSRGFAFVVPSVIGALFALTMVVRTGAGRRRWLWLFAASIFLMVWSFPSGVWYPFGLVAVGFWSLAPGRGSIRSEAGWSPAFRLIAASAFAAMALFHAFVPSVLQALRWKLADPHYIDATLLNNTWTQLLLGVEHSWPSTEDARGLFSLDRMVAGYEWVGHLIRVALTLLAVAGLGRLLLRREPVVIGSIVAVLAAAAVYLLVTSWAEHHYYHRYMIHLLPLYVAGLGSGLVLLGTLATPGQGRRRFVGLFLLPACFFAAWVGCLLPQYRILFERPYAPVEDVALALDRLVEEENAEVFGFGHGSKIVEIYRPGTPYEKDLGDSEIAYAEFVNRQSERPGYVFFGHAPFNQGHFPKEMDELMANGPRLADPLVFRGIEPDFTYRIVKVREGRTKHTP